MSKVTIEVPDIGGFEDVDVIEVNVAVGDMIELEQDLIVLETDKASMEVPASAAGKVVEVLVSEGDKVSEGTAIIVIETDASEAPVVEAEAPAPEAAPAVVEVAPVAAAASERVTVTVPDIGDFADVDVIEVNVAVGDTIEVDQDLIVLETDKASMEVPSTHAGTVVEVLIAEGDKASMGTAVVVVETGANVAPAAEVAAPAPAAQTPVADAAPVAAAPAGKVTVAVPDIGDFEGVDVIEVNVAVGDTIAVDQDLIVLETDKASMEVPSTHAGKVVELLVKEGDKVSKGSAILVLEAEGAAPVAPAVAPVTPAPIAAPAAAKAATPAPAVDKSGLGEKEAKPGDVYAGPSSRRLARQLGVDLTKVKGTGIRGRITKDDIRAYVKSALERAEKAPAAAPVSGGSGIPPIPPMDFSQFGEIEMVKMSRIKKVTAANMSRAWLNVPHVTQFDDADITDLEAFRKSMKAEAEKQGVKLTPLPFLIKAAAMALRAEPSFNVSLHHDGEHIVQKNYVHIGIACDTPNGLMVPVLRDADKKGIYQIAKEANDLIKAARDGKLKPKDMQGGCFTISSLGAIGGSGFTPIVNAPEVAILGVSKAEMKPKWNGSEFVPRNMLPLAVSYDHRAINGADCGRFFTTLVGMIADIRRILL